MFDLAEAWAEAAEDDHYREDKVAITPPPQPPPPPHNADVLSPLHRLQQRVDSHYSKTHNDHDFHFRVLCGVVVILVIVILFQRMAILELKNRMDLVFMALYGRGRARW